MLRVTDLAARVIKQGETGDSLWATERVGLGTITALTIVVSAVEGGEDADSPVEDDEDGDSPAENDGDAVSPIEDGNNNDNDDYTSDDRARHTRTHTLCGGMAMASLFLTAGALVLARRRRGWSRPSSLSKD